jgi:hypothetical protein
MRFLLGAIFGVLLLVVVVFIADSLATSESATGAAPRQIANWDVAADRLDDFTEAIRAGVEQTHTLITAVGRARR